MSIQSVGHDIQFFFGKVRAVGSVEHVALGSVLQWAPRSVFGVRQAAFHLTIARLPMLFCRSWHRSACTNAECLQRNSAWRCRLLDLRLLGARCSVSGDTND